jgi:hypothetical protein
MMSRPPRRVREPVQVYLETSEKELLDQLALRTSLSRAELLRRGLRRLASELSSDAVPGRSLTSLIGALGDDAGIPADLSVRHDEYLYPDPNPDADATGHD